MSARLDCVILGWNDPAWCNLSSSRIPSSRPLPKTSRKRNQRAAQISGRPKRPLGVPSGVGVHERTRGTTESLCHGDVLAGPLPCRDLKTQTIDQSIAKPDANASKMKTAASAAAQAGGGSPKTEVRIRETM